MNGIEEYNKSFDTNAKARLWKNKDKPYLEDFYNYVLVNNSYSSSYMYLCYVIGFINKLKIKDPKDITVNHYTSYMSKIKNNTASYRIAVYSALKKFSSFLKASGINEDHMVYIKRPKFTETTTTKKKREKAYMTEDEIGVFINNVENSNKSDCWKSRDIAMIRILLNTGIRRSALQKLDLDDINFKEGYITVFEKGEKSRELYISKTTMDAIVEWISYREDIVKKAEQAVFVSDRKKRIDCKTIYNIVKSYGVVIDDKNITPHKLRGTFGTQLYNKTGDVYFVQEAMGHSNPKTTEIYIRGQKKNVAKKASDLMDDFLS